MTCRHSKGDPECSSSPGYSQPRSLGWSAPTTSDADRYDIVDAVETASHVIVKVKYPNCSRCAYEGMKVLVFKGVKCKDVLMWKRVDPHFRDKPGGLCESPPPIARFPASKEGWDDAIDFVSLRESRGPR